MIGETVSHYKIVDKIGGGGMGVVYRAEDTKLGRQVALKFLPEQIAGDSQAMERFFREARAAAALNHPHICTIYEVDEHEGAPFIAMELLEGEDLRRTIGGRPMRTAQVLRLTRQVAEALGEAHTKGIVHRDIKPANIFVTQSGHAKIMDFGLAKLTPQAAGSDAELQLSSDPTQADLTEAGSAVGTVAYMSPEQALAEEVDARTDLFSVGAVLYEMTTGRQAFTGASTAAVFDAILHKEPVAVARVAPETPVEVEQIIGKALQKDRTLRYQTGADLIADLRRVEVGLTSSQSVATAAAATDSVQPITMPPAEPDASASGAPVLSGSQEEAVAAGSSSSAIEAIDQAGAKHWKGLLALVVLLAIAAVVIFRFMGRPPPLTEEDDLLLTDFVNTTGDSVFDGTLKQALAVKLRESPFLNVYPDAKIRETLQFMERSPDERITQAIGREICQRQGLKAMMTGQIASLGSEYVVTLEAIDCQSGASLAMEQVEAASKEKVLDAIGTATTSIRRELGESLASLEQYDAPIEEATTSSLEALKALSLGEEIRGREAGHAAIPFLEQAIELDPSFALAHARLGTIYMNMGDKARAKKHRIRAYELRDRVSEVERLYIDSSYYYTLLGDLPKSIETYQLWKETYPRDFTPYNNLSVIRYFNGEAEQCLDEAIEAHQLRLDHILPYNMLVWCYLDTERYDEAKAMGREALDKGLGMPQMRVALSIVARREGDRAALEEHLSSQDGSLGEVRLLHQRSIAAAEAGRLEDSRKHLEKLEATAKRFGFEAAAAMPLAQAAVTEALVGESDRGIEVAGEVVQLSASEDSLSMAGLALALVGETDQARRVIEILATGYPQNTLVQEVGIPSIEAALSLTENAYDDAIEWLETTRPYERKSQSAIYLRALAFFGKGSAEEAAGEFQRLRELHSYATFVPVQSLAQLGLARSLAAGGKTGDARAAYQEFFDLWAEADEDVPILVEARAEYAALN